MKGLHEHPMLQRVLLWLPEDIYPQCWKSWGHITGDSKLSIEASARVGPPHSSLSYSGKPATLALLNTGKFLWALSQHRPTPHPGKFNILRWPSFATILGVCWDELVSICMSSVHRSIIYLNIYSNKYVSPYKIFTHNPHSWTTFLELLKQDMTQFKT